jgi:hypothetical protein
MTTTPTPAETIESGCAAIRKALMEMNLGGALSIISTACAHNPTPVSISQAQAFTYIQGRMETAIEMLLADYQALLGLQWWITETTG